MFTNVGEECNQPTAADVIPQPNIAEITASKCPSGPVNTSPNTLPVPNMLSGKDYSYVKRK